MSDNIILSNMKKPEIHYCSSCVFPSSSAVTLSFDENFICSGCSVSKEKNKINYSERKKQLLDLFKKYENKGNQFYDCVIPVSGGKDSFFQAHIIKELGYNALLVTYNANNYSNTGLKNVQKMREAFGFDHIFFTPAVKTLKKLNKLGMLVMGDMNWHAHLGIVTYPIKVAAEKNIPLVIWGEHGRSELGGMFSNYDFFEFSFRDRVEHDGRGYDWSHMLEIADKFGEKLSKKEMDPWIHPSDDEIDRVGIRGIYIANYIYWEAHEHTKLVKKKYGFLESSEPFERTYRKASNLDDIHENGIHDYLKFVKFGYGRASDHGSKDIRAKKITRMQAIKEVKKRDHIKSKDLKRWLKYVGWTEKKFDAVSDTFRNPRTWWIKNSKWMKNNIWGKSSSYGKVYLPKDQWSKFYIEK